jgi:predicted nucleic acid-binding protein
VALLGVELAPSEASVLVDTGHWRARRYHRVERPVSLADCVAGVCAVSLGVPLATSDEPCADMVRAEGGSVLTLLNSKGR